MREWIKEQIMPSDDSKGERILYLEFIKVLAAFLVVFYHFCYYKLDYGYIEGIKYFPNLERMLMCFAACSVPLFFVVNGILMFRKERLWKSVYFKASKLLLLCIVWSIVGFPAWFFRTMIIIHFMYPLLQYLWQCFKGVYYVLASGIFIMPFLYNLILLILKASDIKVIGFIQVGDLNVTGCFTMYSLLFFMLGPIIEKTKQRYSGWLGFSCIIGGWAMVVCECVTYTNLNQSMYDGVNAAFPTVGALLMSVGIYWVFRELPLQKLSSLLAFLGREILSVYLMHMVVINAIKRVFGSFTLNMAEALGGTCFIFFICVVLGKIIKKIPVLCWLVNI